jgi:tetratricopeptide (TPR) repeat protein
MMMQELANKLIAQARGMKPAETGLVRSSETAHKSIRIGLWPFVSEEAPEVAMGLMVTLASQLDLWPNVVTYRLMLAADDSMDVTTDDLPIDLSQFTVDDWQLEYLGENVAIWGELKRSGADWQLEVFVENDITGADVQTYTISAGALAGLVEQLEMMSRQIAADAVAGYPSLVAINYSGPFSANDAAVTQFLSQVFVWERSLFLTLWQEDSIEVDWAGRLDGLLNAARAVDASLGGGLVLTLLRRALQPATKDFVLAAVENPWDVAMERLPRNAMVTIGTALEVIQQDGSEITDAVRLLDGVLGISPNDDSSIRLVLAELYRSASAIPSMIEVLQAGLVDTRPQPSLYFYYALVLNLLRNSNLGLKVFVLTESSKGRLSEVITEALAAYAAGLALWPDRADMLQQRLFLLIEVQHETLWDEFKHLVEADTTGEYVRSVLESMLILEDIEPALDILADAVEANPDRVDLRINYAVALLQDEFFEEAGAELEIAEDMTDDQSLIAEIERLFLQVNDPDFEARWGEVETLLAAGRALGNAQCAFLEDALEEAPTFAQGYLALAQSHLNANDKSLALEVLLDGQNVLPESAEITSLLAQVLWDAGERDLAFDYLNKGLAHNPEDVPLLALTGQYLFDTEQDEEARLFLARAETLSPRDKKLVEVKRYIAGRL